MAQIGINISFAGYTGSLIIVWKEAIQNNPNPPETGRSDAIAFDVDEVYNIININPVVHLIEFWRSSDDVTLDELLRTWSVDASRTADAPIVAQYDYVVDRGYTNETPVDTGDEVWADPVLDATQIIDERLNGYTKDEIRFEQRGGIKYREDEYDLVTGGGVELLGGFTFGDAGQTYSVTVYKTVPQPGVSASSSDYNDVLVITANGTLDNTYYKKLVVANKAGSGLLTVTFPDLALIANSKIKFQTHGGNQSFLVLQLDSGDTIKFLGENKNKIVLGKGEEIELLFKDNVGYVMHYEGDARRVGARLMDDIQRLNTLKADGTEYNQADYPRLMDFINALPAAQIKSYSDWSISTTPNYVVDQDGGAEYTKAIFPNKGFFAVDNVNSKFKVPDMKNMFIRSLKTFDSVDASDTERTSNKPGAYQIDAFRKHSHEAGGLWNESGTAHIASGGTSNEGEFRLQRSGGEETRGENIGLIPLIVV